MNRIKPSSGRRGFSLVEAMLAMLLVSVLLVAAMRATAASGLAQYKTANRQTARLLANGLINEIVTLAYQEPSGGTSIGPDAGESSGSKASWDDVDDWHNWIEDTPQFRDGSLMPNMTGWRRSVIVEQVSASNPTLVQTGDTGVKRITVTVKYKGVPLATRVAFRTKAP